MQYLQEIHILGPEDHLPGYIPSSILIQHYVSFRIALRRYVVAGGAWGPTNNFKEYGWLSVCSGIYASMNVEIGGQCLTVKGQYFVSQKYLYVFTGQ